eukprot:COSAG04_NODE_864_length_9792_cov_22.506035_3_plen_107_part_00
MSSTWLCLKHFVVSQDKSLAEGAVGCDTPGVDSWKFEGCCADFLWSIPSNNYAVAVGAPTRQPASQSCALSCLSLSTAWPAMMNGRAHSSTLSGHRLLSSHLSRLS